MSAAMTPIRHCEPCPVLDAELWDEPADLGALDWLEALGDDRPRPDRQDDGGGHDET